MRFIRPPQFGTDSIWMTGIVEDRSDPQQRGRVRVRWFGYYDDEILTEHLPWSIVIQDVTSAGIGGVGTSPTGIMEGTLVIGSFLDGTDMQQPAVFGVLAPMEGMVGGSSAGDNGVVNSAGIQDNATAPNTPSNVKFVGSGPKWLQIARGEVGVKEFKSGSNPRVVQYAKTNGFSEDSTPWCSSFAKWVFQQAGLSVDGVTGMARSWTTAKCVEKLTDPLHGCIVVIARGSPPSGHVGFLDGIQGGAMSMLGGNQSDSVNVSTFRTKPLGFYWPVGQPKDGFGIK